MKRDQPRCCAKTKAGKPCGAAPTAGGLCFFHANPAKASELGRIGGRRNRRSRGEGLRSPLRWDGTGSESEILASLFDDVVNRRIGPHEANVLIKIIDKHSRVRENEQIINMQKQLDDLKQVIAMRDNDAPTPDHPFGEEDEEENHSTN